MDIFLLVVGKGDVERPRLEGGGLLTSRVWLGIRLP